MAQKVLGTFPSGTSDYLAAWQRREESMRNAMNKKDEEEQQGLSYNPQEDATPAPVQTPTVTETQAQTFEPPTEEPEMQTPTPEPTVSPLDFKYPGTPAFGNLPMVPNNVDTSQLQYYAHQLMQKENERAWKNAEPRRSGEERAENQMAAYNPPAAEARRSGELRAENQAPVYTPKTPAETTTPVTQEPKEPASQDDYDTRVWVLMGQGYTREQAEQMAKGEFGDQFSYSNPDRGTDIGISNLGKTTEPEQPAAGPAFRYNPRKDQPDSFYTVLNQDQERQDQYNELMRRSKEMGLAQTDEEARAYAINAMAPEMGFNARAIINELGIPSSYYQPEKMKKPTAQENFNARNTAYQAAYEQAIQQGKSIAEAEQAGITAAQNATAVQTPATTTTAANTQQRNNTQFRYNPRNNPTETNTRQRVTNPTPVTVEGRVGAENALAQMFGEAGNEQQAAGGSAAGTTAGTATGTTGSTTSGTNGTASTEVPKGSTYFRPSYGQNMEKGVKAPYRKGGYTMEELEAFGNAPRSDYKYNNGKPAYEGYYLAPDGNYYPVDQEKAAYYRANGGSYNGWEEGMRDYYKTFGTYYGYKPGWNNGGGGSYGGGYRYSPKYSGSSQSVNYASQNSTYMYNGGKNWSF